MTKKIEEPPIGLGIEVGSRMCRVAYVYPDEDRAIVEVPVAVHRVHASFPLTEAMAPTDPYIARNFPTILQYVDQGLGLYVGDQIIASEEVARQVVRRALDDAERFIGQEVAGVVVTYPAWAGARISAALRAGVLAGGRRALACSDIEALAAYFGQRHMAERDEAMVVILAAGFSGVSAGIARITRKGERVLAARGEQGRLSGSQVNITIIQSALREIESAQIPFKDSRERLHNWIELYWRVEEAKLEAVNRGGQATFEVPTALTPGESTPVVCHVSGQRLEDLIQDECMALVHSIDMLLGEADVKREEISHVLLCGGATHHRAVDDLVRETFGDPTLLRLPPEAVSGGAAYIASTASFALDEDSSSGEPSREFLPSFECMRGLVSIVGRDEAVADSPDSGPEGAVRADDLPPIDGVTLEQLRAEATTLGAQHAIGRLSRLRDEVNRVLGSLYGAESRSPGR